MLRYRTSSNAEFSQADVSPSRVVYLSKSAAGLRFRDPQPEQPKPANAGGLGESNNFLAARLGAFVRFDDEELAALGMLARNAKPFRAEHILIHEGRPTDSVYLVVSGLACRFKMLADGRRQILGYLIPGDLCDIHFTLATMPDYCVGIVSNALVVRVSSRSMIDLITRFPKIGRALNMASIIDSMILREWLLSVGQRDALQKLSHFLCEMAFRLEAIGAIDEDGSFDLPVNQVNLADTLGLTSVHINRTLQRLRSDGLIRLCQRRLAILDRERLAMIAGFDGDYLRLRPVAD